MRWVVTHHRFVLGAWALTAIGLFLAAPPFSEVAVRDPATFLPADAPVVQGAGLVEEEWPDTARSDLVVVAARDDGELTADDRAYVGDLVAALDPATGRVAGIETVASPLDAGDPVAASLSSPDEQAVLVTVGVEPAPFSPASDEVVAEVRALVEDLDPPDGLEVGTTGVSSIGADQNAVIARATSQTSVLSALLVLGILLLVFRSPVTPLVPLLTVGLAMVVAQSIVSLLAAAGLEVTDLYESVATVVIFGAGTDYGLFMVSRYREQTKGFADVGTPPVGLVTTAAALVVVITGSAGTTIVGFASQSVAEFGLFRTLGPALAIAMAVALVAGLTVGPALIRLFGDLLFWPRRPEPAPIAGGSSGTTPPLGPDGAPGAGPGTSTMARIADVVSRRPGRVAIATGGALALLATGSAAMELSRDELEQLPDDAPAVVAFRTAEEHFGSGDLNPLQLVIDAPGAQVDDPAAMRALGVASTNLLLLDGVDSVRSLALPTSGEVPEQVAADGDPAAQLGALPDQLQEAAEGASQLEEGVEQAGAGTTQLATGLAQLADQLPTAADGADELADGAEEALAGARALLQGARQAQAGAAELTAGAQELGDGLAEAEDATTQLRDEVATPAEAAISDTVDALNDFTIGRTDPQYLDAIESAGETFALLTGRYPEGHPQAGEQVDPSYPGLAASLDELAAGVGEGRSGARALADGAAELAAGLDELVTGLEELVAGLEQLQAGAGDLAAGLEEARAGSQQLAQGAAELDAGVSGELGPGADELAAGLREGARSLDPATVESLQELFGGEQPFVLTAGMLDDPGLREELSVFGADAGTTRIFLSSTTGPYDPASLALVDEAVEVVQRSLESSPLEGATILPTGTTAFALGMADAVERDVPIIAFAVILGLLLVMGLLLRSAVAPIYMVASVLLSYAAALGVTTLVFQGLLGESGIVWYVPSFLFVLLIALGVDYNIFLIGRAKEEAADSDTRTAIRDAVVATGPTITMAGVILVGTFSVLALAPLQGLRHLGVAAASGILIDTFVVRPLLVPAIATMLGRLNWWPDARWSRP
jgi:putative drug exporter of the RND superfamily